jgi:hypothetical protein
MQPGGPVYDNPIPTRFLVSIDCLKNPAQSLLSSLYFSTPYPFCNSWQNCQLVGWVQGRGSIVQKIAPPPPTPPSVMATGATGENFANPCQYVHLAGWGRGWVFLTWQGLNIKYDQSQKKIIFIFSF